MVLPSKEDLALTGLDYQSDSSHLNLCGTPLTPQALDVIKNHPSWVISSCNLHPFMFAYGEKRSLIVGIEKLKNESQRRKHSSIARNFGMENAVASFNASTSSDHVVGDRWGIRWTLGCALYKYSNLLYLDYDDHDFSLSIEERRARRDRFILFCIILFGEDLIIARKHPSIIDAGGPGAFGVHVWIYYDRQVSKSGLKVIREELSQKADLPIHSIECHSGSDGGSTRWIIDPEYSDVRSKDRRLMSDREVFDELRRLRDLNLKIQGRYNIPGPGAPIYRSPPPNKNRTNSDDQRKKSSDSRFDYGPGNRNDMFPRIAGYAACTSLTKDQAIRYARTLAIAHDRGSRGMSDPNARESCLRDLDTLTAGSWLTKKDRPRSPEVHGDQDSVKFYVSTPKEDGGYDENNLIPTPLSDEEKMKLRVIIERYAGEFLPIHHQYRERTLDSIIVSFQLCMTRAEQDDGREYRDACMHHNNGLALMEQKFFKAHKIKGVFNTRQCQKALLKLGWISTKGDYVWAGPGVHYAKHYTVLTPNEIFDKERLMSEERDRLRHHFYRPVEFGSACEPVEMETGASIGFATEENTVLSTCINPDINSQPQENINNTPLPSCTMMWSRSSIRSPKPPGLGPPSSGSDRAGRRRFQVSLPSTSE